MSELDWRGKPIRQLTPDEMHQFAIWALREITRLRQERDAYLGRAIAAEAWHRDLERELRHARASIENACGNDPVQS